MELSACMYVCVCVCMYVCSCVCVHVCVRVCMYVFGCMRWAPVMGEARAVKQSYPWRLRLPVCIVLCMAAAVFLVVGRSRQAPGTVSEGDDYDTTAVLSLLERKKKEKKKKDRLPKPNECSKSVIRNCHISQCCLSLGRQCYSRMKLTPLA